MSINEQLKTVSLGYCEYEGAYEGWKEAGHFCAFEYCIETFPYKGGDLACPMYGHNCPGSKKQRDICQGHYDKAMAEVKTERGE